MNPALFTMLTWEKEVEIRRQSNGNRSRAPYGFLFGKVFRTRQAAPTYGCGQPGSSSPCGNPQPAGR
ncbi:MAG TPA: hypothetical protein VFF68_10980 [Anaerolineaceae bacterium]|nr:hypothetical protein [Anaerolineaceae bacterium]